MSVKDNLQISKLNATNYSIWKFRMEMILVKEDLFDLIEKETPVTAQDDAFKKRDRQARALIALCIEDSQIIHIKHEATARDMWNKLKSVHERTNLSSKLFLLRKLYSTKLEEGGNMIDHISNILELVDKLRSVGEIIKEDHVAALLLVSVPKSYDNLITALEARPEMELTPELIKNRLTDEYNRRKEQNADRNSSHAYKTYGKANINTPRQNHTNKFCTYCKKKSHYREDCFFLQNKNRMHNTKRHFDKNKPPEKSSICFTINENETADPHQNETRKIPNCINNHINKTKNAQLSNEEQDKSESASGNPRCDCETLPADATRHMFHTRDEKYLKSYDSSADVPRNGQIIKCFDQQPKSHEINTACRQINEITLQTSSELIDDSFYIDSGATQNLCKHKHLFTDFNSTCKQIKVIIANGDAIYSQGCGTVCFQTKTSNGRTFNINLQNAYFVPELQSNLISVQKITNMGFRVIFEGNNCFVKKNNETVLEAKSADNSLYRVICNENNTLAEEKLYSAVMCNNKNCIMLWHKRMGHRNLDDITQLVRDNLAEGISLNNCKHDKVCVECIKNKITEKPYPKEARYRAAKPLDLVHSDLCGPMQTGTISGKYYFLTFIDDHTRFCMIYLLTHKSEVFSKLKEYMAVTKNKFGRYLKNLRSDNGGEYVNNEIEHFLKEKGIKHQLTCSFSPSQNGIAERKNRSLVEMTRCLLAEGNLPHKFWGEAVVTANYLQNRLPTKANQKTPYELWTGRKPDLSHIRTYGCKAFSLIHKSHRGKLDEKASEGILVGYDCRSKGYRIYTSGNRVIISRSVRFIESAENSATIPLAINDNNQKKSEEEIAISPDQDESENMPRRSERSTKGIPPERFSYIANVAEEPKSYSEIQALPEREKVKWYDAMKDEMESLEKNGTWELVELPKKKRAIGSKWTYKIKLNEEGKVERYKARLVAQGFSQKFGTEYEETFAPVVKYTTIRALLAAACYKNLHIKHVDIKTAFLYGELSEEIFLKQPQGFIEQKNEGKVYRLKKAIYGLKQAAKAWNDKIGNVLLENNFKQSKADQCLFTKESDNLYIILYVDDLLIACDDEEKIEEVLKLLRKNFEIKDLGQPTFYLGIVINRTKEGNFKLNQKPKIEALYNSLDVKDQKPTYIPMKPSYQRETQDDTPFTDNNRYRSAIGSLLYIATITRPDISLAVNLLSRKNEKPSMKDWEAVVHLIRYLHTTKELNLTIDNKQKPVLTAYTDADWANDKNDRKSTGGNIFFIGNNPIHWVTKRQNSVALSSTESEYIAAAQAGMEIEWELKLLEDLQLKQDLPVTLYEDNQSCIKLSQTCKTNSRSKHFDVKYFYLKDLQQRNILLLEYCPTKTMLADIFTKALPKPHFINLRNRINLKSLD